MSFLGGAECSTAGNPLSQFSKHVHDDHSLQRDRLVGGRNGAQESFRSHSTGPSTQDQMMQNFQGQNGSVEESSAHPFAMDNLRRDLDGYRVNSMTNASTPTWASEFDPTEKSRMEAAFQEPKGRGFVPSGYAPAEFQRFEMMQRIGSARSASPTSRTGLNVNRFQSPMSMPFPAYGMSGPQYAGIGVQRFPSETTAQSEKGKGRMVELDDKEWEAQFAQIEKGEHDEELEAQATAAMEEELNQMDRSVSETIEMGDFESIWRGIEAEKAEHRTLNGVQSGEEMGATFDDNIWGAFDEALPGPNTFFSDPQSGSYRFEEDNPYSNTSNPFEEGLKIIQEGGNLSLAALAFEAAVQRDPEHVEAWSQLGGAQAQNEKEIPAIHAFEQAIKLDPSNLAALMGLAISYINEGYDGTAFRTLERWLSVKYPQIIPPNALTPESDFGFTDRAQLHERVTNLFIKAAQLSPGGEHMDPDVQVGLGVLFYGAEEFDKAIDCFEAALASTEEGTTNTSSKAHLLWNRLGATLANSGRSEAAIEAYEKALRLNPNFVRARYNLGVSCINIGVYEQAAQHLLGALNMHRVTEQEGRERVRQVLGDSTNGTASLPDDKELDRMISMNESTNLIETLRRVFGNMQRKDLADRVEPGMDIDSFRGEFDF